MVFGYSYIDSWRIREFGHRGVLNLFFKDIGPTTFLYKIGSRATIPGWSAHARAPALLRTAM